MIISHNKEWDKAAFVLSMYALIGFILVFVSSFDVFLGWRPLNLDVINCISPRAGFFWSYMLILFPPIFILFSIFAPVKLNVDTYNKNYVWICVLIFILIGAVSVPYFIMTFISCDVDKTSGIGRLIAGAYSDDSIPLFVDGMIVIFMLLASMWISYVAIPIAIWKLSRLPTNRDRRK